MDEIIKKEIQALLNGSINQLHHFVLMAEFLHGLTVKMHNDTPHNLGLDWLSPVPDHEVIKIDPKIDAKTIESAGVRELYKRLVSEHKLDILYGNDWYDPRGFDCIAYQRESDTYYICESKGTTRPITYPTSYLKKTKTKGRQLSWEWCWKACLDYSEQGFTANVFLKLYPRILKKQGIKRILGITQVKEHKGYYTTIDFKLIDEEILNQYDWLSAHSFSDNLHRWHKEILELETNVKS